MNGSMGEWRDGPFEISTDRSRLDVGLIHGFLSRELWDSEGIPRGVVERSIEHSLCFGVYEGQRQVGFARVVTDRATFAFVADDFVVESHRGRGLAKWLPLPRVHPAWRISGCGPVHDLRRRRRTGVQGR